jgi:hypothetical protein
MPLVPRSLKWRTILLTLLGLIAVGVSGWWTFRADVTAYIKLQQTLAKFRDSTQPIDRAVGGGGIRAGMPVDEWADAFPPKYRFRHDEYQTLRYDASARREKMTVIAVDGKVVFAGTDENRLECSFAGRLSPDEVVAYRASILRWVSRYTVAKAMVGGIAFTGSQNPWDFPTPLTEEQTEQP